jgi:hypothetical protein
MKPRPRNALSIFLLIGILASIVNAAPRITVDTAFFDLGVVYEGSTKTVRHIFTIKNSGSDPLQIFSVRPGCTCTEVKFDTLIPAGGVGKVTETIVLKDLAGGQTTKTITIQSNAENRQALTLSLNLWYVRHLDVVGDMVIMEGTLNDTARTTITLTSPMKELSINRIRFIPDPPSAAGKNAPISNINFSVHTSNQANSQGAWEYQIALSGFLRTSCLGHFVFSTNHPRKPELRVNGVVRNPL